MDDKEFEIEKKRLQHSREKFWVGSVALVLLASIINYQIQQRELDLKQLEEENRHLSQFINQIVSEDPQVRVIVAEYFETVSLSKDARNRWSDYSTKAREYVTREREADAEKRDQEQKIQDLERQLADAEASNDSAEVESLTAKLDEANSALAVAQRTIQALNPSRRLDCSSLYESGKGIGRPFFDPASGCWACPEGYKRTISPSRSKKACAKGNAFTEAVYLGKLRMDLGIANVEVRG